MGYFNQIKSFLTSSNGIITRKQLIALNIPTIYLTRLVDSGELTRIDRGIYIDSTGDYDEQYFFQQKYSVAIYSYVSALVFHDMTDVIPQDLEVTVYKGYNTSRMPSNVRVHYVSKEIHELGVITVKTIFGNSVKAYNKERTICDLIKHRAEMESEIFAKAIHCYVKSKDKDLYRLHAYAQKMKISQKVDDIMTLFI